MPTPTGLPKPGEIWERSWRLPPDWETHTQRFIVLERSRGDYWSMRVYAAGHGVTLWVDPAYWMQQGQLKFIRVAEPELRKKLNL